MRGGVRNMNAQPRVGNLDWQGDEFAWDMTTACSATTNSGECGLRTCMGTVWIVVICEPALLRALSFVARITCRHTRCRFSSVCKVPSV